MGVALGVDHNANYVVGAVPGIRVAQLDDQRVGNTVGLDAGKKATEHVGSKTRALAVDLRPNIQAHNSFVTLCKGDGVLVARGCNAAHVVGNLANSRDDVGRGFA
jgi:hypothetical protein